MNLEARGAALLEQVCVSRRPLSLRANFVWILGGNFAYGACQWLMLVAIAKMGTPEMVGRFALAFAVTAPVFLFANMNMRGIVATDFRGIFSFGDHFGLRLALLLLAIMTMSVWSIAAFDSGTAAVIILVALAKACESLSDLHFGLIQSYERMDWIARSLMVKGLSSVTVLTLALYLRHSLILAMAAVALSWAAMLFLYDIPKARSLTRLNGNERVLPTWNPPKQWRLARLAFPLGLATLLASLLTNVPRYFIESRLGARELGFFAATAYVMVIGTRVVTALGESVVPRLSRYFSNGNIRAYRSLVFKGLLIAIVLGIAGVVIATLFGRLLLGVLYRPEYESQAGAFTLLMIVAAINYVALLMQYGLTASHTFKPQPIVLAASLVTGTVVSALLIVGPTGTAGAAIAMLVAAVVQFLGNAFFLGRTLSKAQLAS